MKDLDTSPKNIYRWQISTWKDAPHDKSSGKFKLKQDEITPHTYYGGPNLVRWSHQVLVRAWSNRHSHSLLLGMQMVQPLWKTAWWFFAKLNVLLYQHASECKCTFQSRGNSRWDLLRSVQDGSPAVCPSDGGLVSYPPALSPPRELKAARRLFVLRHLHPAALTWVSSLLSPAELSGRLTSSSFFITAHSPRCWQLKFLKCHFEI